MVVIKDLCDDNYMISSPLILTFVSESLNHNKCYFKFKYLFTVKPLLITIVDLFRFN